MIIAVILAGGSLISRLRTEYANRYISIIVEYRDIVNLSSQARRSREDVMSELRKAGVLGITVAEFTGKDLAAGIMPLSFVPLSAISPSDRAGLDLPLDLGTLELDSSDPILPPMMDYLRTRMPGVVKHVPGKTTLVILPIPFNELTDAGIVPDIAALQFAESCGVRALYRPAGSTYSNSELIADAIVWIKKRFPSVSGILPAGNIIMGYPNLGPIVRVMKEQGLIAAQAEFVTQIGVASLMSQMAPRIIPLHSITREEVVSRRYSRQQIVDRMLRAAHERSIRFLLMRPYDLYSTDKLDAFVDDVKTIRDSLHEWGYAFAWPRGIPTSTSSLFASLALSIIFLATALSFVARYFGEAGSNEITLFDIGVFAAITFAFGLAIRLVPSISRLIGGFTAAFVATEAVLFALDRYTRPLRGILAGLLIIICGGLVIAAFYGTSDGMLRLTPFSGVQITLLLPPLLVFAHDLKRRVHPESIADLLSRPPLWGEIVLVGGVLLGAMIVSVRSGNSGSISGAETSIRDFLEWLLWVRPRTKEFLIGYPCLVIYYSLRRSDAIKHYRELFRIGATVGFASAVNTFCHFHTLLPITLLRVVNGWWLGILIGVALLVMIDFIAGPLWKKGGRELFR